jgi:hypothetical protein
MVTLNEILVRDICEAKGLNLVKLPRNQWIGQEAIDIVVSASKPNLSITTVLEVLEEIGYDPILLRYLEERNS